MFTCEIDGLDDLVRDWSSAVSMLADGVTKGVERGVTDAAAEARSSHAYKDHSGDLTRSIRGYLERSAASTGGDAIGYIEATSKHASYVEEGTAAHDIWPKAGQGSMGPLPKGQSRRAKGDIGTHRSALRWTGPDGIRFAKMVHHPGGRSMPFMGPALQKAERGLDVEIGIAVERVATLMSR